MDQRSNRSTFAIAAVATAAGVYFMLVGAGVLPAPGGPRNLHAPLWVVFACGVPFFLAGLVAAAQALAHADERGNLPTAAPSWLKLTIHVIVVAIFICFAAIASWVAFGDGPRQFSGTIGGVGGSVAAGIGRVVFGFGAVILWPCTIAYAWGGFKRLQSRPPEPRI